MSTIIHRYPLYFLSTHVGYFFVRARSRQYGSISVASRLCGWPIKGRTEGAEEWPGPEVNNFSTYTHLLATPARKQDCSRVALSCNVSVGTGWLVAGAGFI